MKKNPATKNSDAFAKTMRGYGCPDLIPLDERLSTPAQLEYLDLLPKRGDRAKRIPVKAVAEHQGSALLYIVEESDFNDPTGTIPQLQQQLANRSDPAWLGVVRPGSLEIFPIDFRPKQSKSVKTIQADDERAPFFFQSLVHGTFLDGKKRPRETDYVFRRIFELLDQTTQEFVPTNKLNSLEVLSLCGRALFYRFLIDRRIVLPDEIADICPTASGLKDAFSNAEKAAQTSAWLDWTFNGDFLPLFEEKMPSDDRKARLKAYRRYFRAMEKQAGKSVYLHLQAILNGWTMYGDSAQTTLSLDWNDFDFAHIPVGVLSQVYESFSHLDEPTTAKQRSVHYTPRLIANLMVDEVFGAEKDPANAQVLDPSCGAGIFLVLAFRRIFRERWQRDEKRPDTRTIQNILYRQICGFDVSESALRLAALALYITAIELNASPRPPKSLKFPSDLRGRALHLLDDPAEWDGDDWVFNDTEFRLGSLHPNVGEDFNKRFQIVIGNPPWSRLRADDETRKAAKKAKKAGKKPASDLFNDAFTKIGKEVLEERGFGNLAKTYSNPDKNPDLPFLWRATQWAKDDALIAMTLPARLIQHATMRGSEPWQAVMKSIRLNGLINGADLRKTGVWEDMDFPWCILFAQNSTPPEEHRFYYTTPSYEKPLNQDGRFRIDYESARPVICEDVTHDPWILKALSLGTPRDIELIRTIKGAFPNTLAEAWKEWDRKGVRTGKGFDRSPGLAQKPAELLGELKVFIPVSGSFKIPYESLPTYMERYGVSSAYRPKTEALYQAPLVIIPQSPGDDRNKPKAYLSDRELGFSQSYYGYSCTEHSEADTLAAILYLLPHSTLFEYFCLMTSARSGADRQTFNKEEFDAIPFPDVSGLPAKSKTLLQRLADRLQNDATKPWEEIDAFLFRLYGLDEIDVQTAKDTLFAAAAYRTQGKAALHPTQKPDRDAFSESLIDHLEPFFDVCGEHVSVVEPEGWQQDYWRESWAFVAVSRKAETVPVNPSLMNKAMAEANARGASRILVRAPRKRGLLLGLLNQRRWWTRTRARMCGQTIVREYLDAFGLPE